MDLVDEQDRTLVGLELGEHGLEPLLEVAAVAGAGQERSHVEGEDDGVAQDLRHLALDDPERQALGDGGLADAGVAHEQGIVLGAAAQDLDRALDLELAPDQDVDPALAGLLVEVGAVGRQRLAPLPLLLAFAFLGTANPPILAHSGLLGDPVRDVVDGVEPRHALLLQEVDGMALALGEHRHQHVGAGDLVAAGRLDVDRGPGEHPGEAGGGLGLDRRLHHEARELAVEEVHERGPQALDLDRTGAQHGGRVLVLGQRHQQVLEGGIFVLAGAGQGYGAPDGPLEVARHHRHHVRLPIHWAAGQCGMA